MAWRRGQAYSQDLRSRVLGADEGERVGAIAARLRVSVSYVSKVLSRRERTGVTTALPQRCHVPGKLSGLHDSLRARVMAVPDATLAELRAWLAETHHVAVSLALLCTTLATLRLTYKEALRAAEQDRPDVAAARTAWREQQPSLSRRRLMEGSWCKADFRSWNSVRNSYVDASRTLRCGAYGRWS